MVNGDVFSEMDVKKISWPDVCVGCGTSDLSHSIQYPADLIYKREKMGHVFITDKRRREATANLYLCSSCEKKSIQESERKMQMAHRLGIILKILVLFFIFSGVFILDFLPSWPISTTFLFGVGIYSIFIALLFAGYSHSGSVSSFQEELIDDPYLRYVYLGLDGFLFVNDKYLSEFTEENPRIKVYTLPELFTRISYPLYKGRLIDNVVLGCCFGILVSIFVGSMVLFSILRLLF